MLWTFSILQMGDENLNLKAYFNDVYFFTKEFEGEIEYITVGKCQGHFSLYEMKINASIYEK